jgi:hypothetical protein
MPGAHTGKKLLLFVGQECDVHAPEDLAHVWRGAPVIGTGPSSVFEFDAGCQNLRMREQIKVLNVIPMQMRQEHRVDVFRRQSSRVECSDQHRPDAKRSGVEQDGPACDAKQQQQQ